MAINYPARSPNSPSLSKTAKECPLKISPLCMCAGRVYRDRDDAFPRAKYLHMVKIMAYRQRLFTNHVFVAGLPCRCCYHATQRDIPASFKP